MKRELITSPVPIPAPSTSLHYHQTGSFWTHKQNIKSLPFSSQVYGWVQLWSLFSPFLSLSYLVKVKKCSLELIKSPRICKTLLPFVQAHTHTHIYTQTRRKNKVLAFWFGLRGIFFWHAPDNRISVWKFETFLLNSMHSLYNDSRIVYMRYSVCAVTMRA